MVLCGDALEVLKTLPPESVNMCVTSPPYYGLRDYGTAAQIGMEDTPEEYITRLVEVFREVRRVLRSDGTLWVNIGDSYAGSWHGRNADGTASSVNENKNNLGSRAGTVKKKKDSCKPKDLIGVPWMLAFALRADGWYLRQDIIWMKPNAMPESVKDRCTKSHEYLFLLSKSKRYYFDAAAIQEPRVDKRDRPVFGSEGAFGPPQAGRRGSGNKGKRYRPTPGRPHLGGHIPYSGEQEMRNKRDVWAVAVRGHKGAHFAMFPEQLVEPCILAGSPPDGGAVLDCFNGAGTTGVVCAKLGREYIGIEINPDYVQLSNKRISAAQADVFAKRAQGMIEGF